MTAPIITRVGVEQLRVELGTAFAIAGGTLSTADNLLVSLFFSDGSVGTGEAAPFPAVSGETASSTRAAIERLTPLLCGRSLGSFRRIAAEFAEAELHAPAARCAIEQALFDALAIRSGLPLEGLLGGADQSLTTDMTITACDLDDSIAQTRAAAARFNTLKLKVGREGPEADAERVIAIARVAPNCRLIADANEGFTPEQAIRFVRLLKKQGVELGLLEQPVAADDLAGLAQIARETGVAICADESARGAADVARLAQLGAAQLINLKITKCGVVETIAMHHVAKAHGLGLMIGGMVETELSMSFSARLASGLGGFSEVDLDTPLFLKDSPLLGGFQLEGARIRLPDALGHGVRRRSPAT